MKALGPVFLSLLLLLGIAAAQQSTQRMQPSAQAAVSAQQAIELSKPLQMTVADFQKREQGASPQIRSQLAALRKELADHKARFTIGYTTAMDVPLEVLAGTRIPRNLAQSRVAETNRRGAELLAIDHASAVRARVDLSRLLRVCNANAASFDWRTLGKVTPVKAQICGTCWDFTAMGAYEGSYALRNNVMTDASEQYVLNCTGAGNCSGGWWMPVFDAMIASGNTTEAADPFTGNDSLPCPGGVPLSYRASAWAFVGPDVSTIPTVQQIKAALCQHGPLATALMADSAMVSYTGGVFDESWKHFDWINHGVTIIGWDDSKKAWLIKNSWGTGWGETGGYGSSKGYGWIAYNTNNIGIATAWVDAASKAYVLNPDWIKRLEYYHIPVKPIPPDHTPITREK